MGPIETQPIAVQRKVVDEVGGNLSAAVEGHIVRVGMGARGRKDCSPETGLGDGGGALEANHWVSPVGGGVEQSAGSQYGCAAKKAT